MICYHAWESYQFPDGATQNDVGANPLKPNNMVGGYGHLQYRSAYLSMNNIPKEVAVEVEKVHFCRWARRDPMAKGVGESAEKIVKDIRRRTRRRFSAEEKIRIVLERLRSEESIATLCRRELQESAERCDPPFQARAPGLR